MESKADLLGELYNFFLRDAMNWKYVNHGWRHILFPSYDIDFVEQKMQRDFVSGEICGSKIIWRVATSNYCGTFSSYCKIGPAIYQPTVLTLHGKMPWEVFYLIYDFLTS